LNRVELTGRLAADPEPRATTSDTQVARLRLAVKSRRTRGNGHRDADFLDVTVFGVTAENCVTYLRKGRLVAISGHLKPSQWEAEDGTRRYRLDVIAEEVEFLGGKPTEDQQPNAAEAAA
jgi:single-strand DNA-binding protein